MSEEKTLFDKARTNYEVAAILLANSGDDEAFLNQAGYHLQQAVELAIKFELEISGVEYVKTHDIDQLIRLAKNNKVDLHLPEYIEDHSEMFSAWESKTRYILGYLIEREKIEKSLAAVETMLVDISEM